MNRRGFLGTILTLAAAPAIVRASSLMPVRQLDGLRIVMPAGYLYTEGAIEVVASAPWPPLGETFEEILRRRIIAHHKEMAACILRNVELLNRYTGQHS